MEILYLLIPMSAVLVLLILGVFGWAVNRGQFDDLDHEGERILYNETTPTETPLTETPPVDGDQSLAQGRPEQSRHRQSGY